jgi:hypothetical protein
MIFAYLCRIARLASLVILILKVRNNGWTVLSVIVGLFSPSSCSGSVLFQSIAVDVGMLAFSSH